jgi:hypothetical protein
MMKLPLRIDLECPEGSVIIWQSLVNAAKSFPFQFVPFEIIGCAIGSNILVFNNHVYGCI